MAPTSLDSAMMSATDSMPCGTAVADAHAVDDDRAHLAVEHFVGASDFFFQAGGDGHHLEGRAGLVDVADGAVSSATSVRDLLVEYWD